MIRTVVRVLAGFALACLTAGLVQVLFAVTPSKLLASPANVFAERALQTGVFALLAATHTAIFSAAFALIACGIGEWMRVRSVGYYLASGAVIALLGFAAQYSSEVAGQPTILNNYALQAYLTAGFFAGLAYWLTAGRGAGGRAADRESRVFDEGATIGVPPPAKSWKSRPRIVVEDAPKPGTREAKKASLAERLVEAEAETAKSKTDDKPAVKVTPAATTTAEAAAATKASVPSTKPAPSVPNRDSDPGAKAKDDDDQPGKKP